ncbi:50S ribosomal protein L11 methyltransferase [Geminocystis sp.]|uniref:50S ribosomal protein L11 methyltransferase n=1 Tax=Geminocystis sp. TaxID=2664100 RepID=UPI003594481E
MTTPWWEIKINHIPELEDTIFWRLQEFGCQGTALAKEDNTWFIKAYIPAITKETIDLAALSLWFEQDCILTNQESLTITWKLIDDEDWASSWKDHWQPMEIGDRFCIYPAWIEVPEVLDRIVIRLDPGSAFGTGVHATTQLCLESLEMRLGEPEKELIIADIGCGSGILSIGARFLGAKQVFATDIDPLATRATKENMELNAVDNIEIFDGSIELLKLVPNLKFDGIVCNILAEVIKTMIPDMPEIIKPDGWVILSGILVDQSIEIATILEKNGWTIAALWKRGEWCCLNARRSK